MTHLRYHHLKGLILVGLLVLFIALLVNFFGRFRQTTEDKDHDGQIDTWTYSSWNGVVRKIEEDRNQDRRPDLWTSYDADGEMSQIEKDKNYDGKPDLLETFLAGRISSGRYDFDLDGIFEIRNFYNKKGGLIRLERARNKSGRIDAISFYDGKSSHPKRIELDEDGDGRFETVKNLP
jgi:hypothetical protein